VLPILYVVFEKGIKWNPLKKNVTTVIVLLMLSVTATNAQNTISLEKALETAVKNNASVKNERLLANYQQKLIKSATNLPTTNLIADFGQINSYYNDNRFGISQAFDFPTVYNRQKKHYTEESKKANILVAMKESELKKEVTQSFYAYIYLQEKEKLLLKSDTIFEAFLKKSILRFKNGESNILEKTTAETQRGNIKMQLIQLLQEKELVKSQFQLLLNAETDVAPKNDVLKLVIHQSIDSTLVMQHPNLQFLEQQQKVSNAATKLEKAKLLPIITLGYNNTSITGTGADNVLYDKSARFQSGQVGLGIPLFGGSQKAKIEASKVVESIAENEYQKEKMMLQKQYKNALSHFNSSIEKMIYFEKTALPNADIITTTANRQFINGDINYLDWLMLINQSIAIKSSYLDAVSNQNEAVIQLNYLTSKQ
jgi:cobalt-zinc-cadmium resistance protein CzcA